MPKGSGQYFRQRGGDTHWCKKCDRRFNTSKLLSLHEKHTHDISEVVFKCPTKCGAEFKNEMDLRKHIDGVHRRSCGRELTVESWKLSTSGRSRGR